MHLCNVMMIRRCQKAVPLFFLYAVSRLLPGGRGLHFLYIDFSTFVKKYATKL